MAILRRKIEEQIRSFYENRPQKILIVEGARQVGKSFIIRQVGRQIFKNFVEVNLLDDANSRRRFESVRTTEELYIQLGILAGGKLTTRTDTLVFLDEIQAYPHLLTMLKFLVQDSRYSFIASGSLLGVTLSQTVSTPMGSIEIADMYPLDFEEFLWANGMSEATIEFFRDAFRQKESLGESFHDQLMDLFKKYLLVGGLPEAVKSYLETYNIVNVRKIQTQTYKFYGLDAAQYDKERKLKITNVYSLIPSMLENRKKRIVAQEIEGRRGKTMRDYQDEFDYLISAGIALDVKAISNPKFPLLESTQKNLLKLYLNDVGILTNLLYGRNVDPILNDVRSINLGSVYESVVAQELKAHGHALHYYDNKQQGEVDFLIDNYDTLSVLPIEVKSGKDYQIHSALNNFTKNEEYHIDEALVLSNNRVVQTKGKITYMPVYYVLFL